MARADRVPRAPGDRRRRPDRDDDRRDRRPRPAARARQVPGLLRRRLRRLDRDRPAARRLLRRPPLLALDLLHQPAGRRRRARRDRGRVPRATRRTSATGSTISAPRCSPAGSRRSSCSRASAGRPGRGARPRSIVLVVLGVVLARRRSCFVERSAAEPILPLALFRNRIFTRHERDRLHRRLRALRRGDLPAALPADRQGPQPDRVRARC